MVMLNEASVDCRKVFFSYALSPGHLKMSACFCIFPLDILSMFSGFWILFALDVRIAPTKPYFTVAQFF